MREENEGYSKLITELNQDHSATDSSPEVRKKRKKKKKKKKNEKKKEKRKKRKRGKGVFEI